jgi:alpha-L-fucosidase 2
MITFALLATNLAAQHLDVWFEGPAKLENGPNGEVAGQNDALPVGNGRLGAIIFGHTDNELLQINEDSIWKKKWANSTINPESKDTTKCVSKVRQLLEHGNFTGAESAAECLMGVPDGSSTKASINSLLAPFQPLMDIRLNFTGAAQVAEKGSYLRGLNLSNGISSVSHSSQNGDTHFKRTAFSSATSDIIVVDMVASGPQTISSVVSLSRLGTGNDTAVVTTSQGGKQLVS